MKNFRKLIKEAYLGNPLNEELKLGIKYELPTGETGYIMTGGSKDPKDWKFSGNKESYLSVKDKLKPIKKQPGKFDGAYDLGMGKGHHIDEGTCGYGEDGVLGEEPAGPHLQKEESEGDKEIRALEKEAEKYPKTDSRYKVIQKKIGDLKFEKDYALPGSKADKKFSDMEDEMERLLNKGVGYKSSIYSNFMNEVESGDMEEDNEMTPEEEHEHVKNLLKRNFMDETEAKLNESPYPTSKKYKELENVINNELTSKGELFKGMRNNDLKAILRALKGKKTYMLSTDRQKMLRQLMGKAGTLKELDIESSSDAALDNEVNKTGFAESKEFNFKKMIKEALTPNYLK